MLVTLEGLDGSGKSTVAAALERAFPDACLTREPTETWYGEAVNRSLADPDADPLAELFLYTADHADHLSRTVRPAVERGDLVISDRYSDSRFAYQAAALDDVLEDSLAYVRAIHEPWSRPPDRTLYLDVSPATGAARSEGANKFERVAFLERVRDQYERLLANEPERFVRIDAERPTEDVTADAVAAVRTALREG